MEKISDRQLGGIIVLIIGSGILMSGGSDRSLQNAWVAAVFAGVIAIPVFLVYARIGSLFPGKGLFEITYSVFGKIFGSVIVFLMSLYAFYVGAMSMRQFSEFNQVVSMPETTQILTLVFFGGACIYIIKKGVKTLGSVANLFLPLIIFLILLINILSIKDWEIYYTLPLMDNPGKTFFNDIFVMTIFPVCESVLALSLLGFKKEKGGCKKIFLWGLGVGAALLVTETLRSIMVLGPNTISLMYYPSYTATGVINIMDFFTRIEVIVSASFLIAQIVKVSVCIYAVSSGIGSLVGSRDYKSLAAPSVFAMIALGFIIFKNTIESYEFLETYKYYGVLFQIIFPVLIWTGAEIYKKREKKLCR